MLKQQSINNVTIYPALPMAYIDSLSNRNLCKLKETIKLVRKDLKKGELVHMCNIIYVNRYERKTINKSQYEIFAEIIDITLNYRQSTEGRFSTFSNLYNSFNKDKIRTVEVLLGFRLGWLDKLTRYINKTLKQRNI